MKFPDACRPMYVPLDATAAPRAAIALSAAGPWRLIELRLVDFPDACVAPQEGECDGAADRQQFGRPDLRQPRCAAAPAAKTSCCEGTTMQGRVHLQIEPPRREAARAIDVQLHAVAGDVADGLERELAEHLREP
jgi:hypothetical protein